MGQSRSIFSIFTKSCFIKMPRRRVPENLSSFGLHYFEPFACFRCSSSSLRFSCCIWRVKMASGEAKHYGEGAVQLIQTNWSEEWSEEICNGTFRAFESLIILFRRVISASCSNFFFSNAWIFCLFHSLYCLVWYTHLRSSRQPSTRNSSSCIPIKFSFVSTDLDIIGYVRLKRM